MFSIDYICKVRKKESKAIEVTQNLSNKRNLSITELETLSMDTLLCGVSLESSFMLIENLVHVTFLFADSHIESLLDYLSNRG